MKIKKTYKMWAVFYASGLPTRYIDHTRKQAIDDYNSGDPGDPTAFSRHSQAAHGIYVARCDVTEIERKAKKVMRKNG